MPRRRSQFKPSPLAEVLRKFMKKQGLPPVNGDPALRRLWNEAVGDQIAAHTMPDSIRRGTLFVKVSSSVWMHQLQFLKKDILQRFNGLYGKETVRSLNFSIGEIPAPPPGHHDPASPAASLAALNARDQRLVQESLAAVRDPELQEILRRVMTREISRRRLLEKRRDR